MKYTIAVPTYNNEKTIARAVLSVLNQKFHRDFEIIVVNNASTDKTSDVLAGLQEQYKFKVVDNTKTVSLFENHNVCLREASGDYVLFCHSDDTLYEDALTKLDVVLSRYSYPEKIVCWGRSFFRDFLTAYKDVGELNNIVSGRSVQQLFQGGGLTPSGTCYSKISFLKSGGFLPMVNNVTPSDMTSMLKYSLDGAEFLMIDRLLFKRDFASTASGQAQKSSLESVEHAMDELAKVVPHNTMITLFDNINTFSKLNLWYMIVLSKYSSNKKLKLKYKIKYILKNLFSLRNKFVCNVLLNK